MESLIEIAACASTAADTKSDPLANLALHLHRLAPAGSAHSHMEASHSSTSSTGALTAGSQAHSSPHGVPVCLLHGLQDRLVDVSESVRVYRSLKAAGSHVSLIKVDHCGHVLHEEFPALFLEHMFGFLSELAHGQHGARAEEEPEHSGTGDAHAHHDDDSLRD
jgi:pimeloyl-ACP methyl ester carboxylesterase